MGFSSCKGKDDNTDTPATVYTVDVTAASAVDDLNFTGAEVVLNVTAKDDKGADASVSWNVSSSADWITFDPQRGKGKGSIKVTVAANQVEAVREGTVTVTLAEGGAKKDVALKQQARQMNWTITRKGTLAEHGVGLKGPFPADYGDHSIGTYTKCECGADGWLELKTTYRLHYYILDAEPGYWSFIDVNAPTYSAVMDVEIASGKNNFNDCRIPNNSPVYLAPAPTSDWCDNGEIWDHGRGAQEATHRFHVKAGTYWFVCTRAGGGAEPAGSKYSGQGLYPYDVEIDEIIKFEKD
jgi:hypothetical protein